MIAACVSGALVISVIAGVTAYTINLATNVHYDQFLKSCVQDHKEYECVLMWRKS
jgi:hypothetical protein